MTTTAVPNVGSWWVNRTAQVLSAERMKVRVTRTIGESDSHIVVFRWGISSDDIACMTLKRFIETFEEQS